jgi:hypothetical protein
MMLARAASALVLLLATAGSAHAAAELGGSLSSMTRQHGVALRERYAFVTTAAQARAQVARGALERVTGNDDFAVDAQVRHPFAQPEVILFLERLGEEYHAATGTRLVVTSLLRPKAEQPANAHRLSVHPAGMAVDLRVPARAKDRAWLERALVELEGAGVLDATREQRPPHYHVAVFPSAYRTYVERQDGGAVDLAGAAPVVAGATLDAPMADSPVTAAPAAEAVVVTAPAAPAAVVPAVPVRTMGAPVVPSPGGEGMGVGVLALGLALSAAGVTVAHRRQARAAA